MTVPLKFRIVYHKHHKICRNLYSQLQRTYTMSSKSKDTKNSDSSEAERSECSQSGSMTVEGLKQYLVEKFGIMKLADSDGASSDIVKPKILDDVSMDGVVNFIKKKDKLNIVTMAGAGISTSAGIPDFRSPGSGLYHNLQKYNLPSPQSIFELDFFEKNPKPFFVLAKELYPGSFKPTPCHYFIKLLETKGLLLRHYTQNIDTLERVAEIPESKLIEAHGTFYTGHCQKCKRLYDLEWMKEKIFADEIPTCTKKSCTGVVKPDIVFFGENLPYKFYECVDDDFAKCDLLIVMGSSLVVQPFASLVDRVSDSCPRILINREKSGERNGIWALIGIGFGMDFDGQKNSRDVPWLGDCDEGCQLFADKLGWGEELREMIKKGHEAIDKKDGAKAEKSQKTEEKSKDEKTGETFTVELDKSKKEAQNRNKM